MKIAKACRQCREGKRRCNQSTRAHCCDSCERRGLRCSNTRAKGLTQRRTNQYPALVSKAANNQDINITTNEHSSNSVSIEHDPTDLGASASEITELVTNYLYYIHDKPHSLFHKPTLWKEIRNGTIAKQLLYAICAIGARFCRSQQLRDLRPRFVSASKKLLREDIEHICLPNVQSCILLADTCAAEFEMGLEALYFGIANRMAHLLGLHTIDPNDSIVQRETKSRVWWTLVMADTWCSSGLGLPRQLLEPRKHAQLPFDEYVFQKLDLEATSVDTTPTPGLWAHMIALVEMFSPIQQLNRQVAEKQVDESRLDDYVKELAKPLDDWITGLPENVQWNEVNLAEYRRKDLGGAFVALHLGFFHYTTLLFFQYLDHQIPATPRTATYARKCRHHAFCYSEVLRTAREMGGCDAVYITVGHMTVVSSSVLLHILLFGDETEIPLARESLQSNFAALVELKHFWPSLDRTINRLLTFQNACICSVDSNTHKMDRWMVRFLLEHALPLDSKHPSDTIAPISADSPEFFTGEHGFQKRQNMTSRALAGLFS